MDSLNRSLDVFAYPNSFILPIVNKKVHRGDNLEYEIVILNNLLIIHLPLNVISNYLIIATVWLIRNLDRPDNYIIGAIAVVDLLTGLFAIPSVILVYAKQSRLQQIIKGSSVTCVIGWITRSFGPATALTLLTFMAFQRYLAINHPFWYTQTMSIERVMWTMFLLFLLQLIFHVTVFTIHPPYSNNETFYFQCTAKHLTHWYLDILIPLTWVELLLGSFFVIQVACIARKQFHKQHCMQILLKGYDHEQSSYQLKQVKITMKLMFLYILLWIPVLVGMVVYVLSSDLQLIRLFNIIGYHSVFISSWSNALVYATTKSTYRKAFKFLLTTSPRKWNTFSSWLGSHTYHTDGRAYDSKAEKDARSGPVTSDQPSYYQVMRPNKSMAAQPGPAKQSIGTWLDAIEMSSPDISKSSSSTKSNKSNKSNKIKSNKPKSVMSLKYHNGGVLGRNTQAQQSFSMFDPMV